VKTVFGRVQRLEGVTPSWMIRSPSPCAPRDGAQGPWPRGSRERWPDRSDPLPRLGSESPGLSLQGQAAFCAAVPDRRAAAFASRAGQPERPEAFPVFLGLIPDDAVIASLWTLIGMAPGIGMYRCLPHSNRHPASRFQPFRASFDLPW